MLDFWSAIALCLLVAALLVIGWGLFSPPRTLPAWTHRHDKLWHIIAFAGLAFLIQGVWPLVAIWWPGLWLCLAGLLTEVVQERYAPGRRFSWGDVAANTVGTVLGLLIAQPLWGFTRQAF